MSKNSLNRNRAKKKHKQTGSNATKPPGIEFEIHDFHAAKFGVIQFGDGMIQLTRQQTIHLGFMKASPLAMKFGTELICQYLADHATNEWAPPKDGYYKSTFITENNEIIMVTTNLDETLTYVKVAIPEEWEDEDWGDEND